MTYDAILFDNDGVLLEYTPGDSVDFDGAVRSAFRDHGVTAPDDDHVADLVYDVTADRVEGICASYGLDVGGFWQSRDDHCSRVQRAAIRAGRKGLYADIVALDDLDRPMGVVSSNQQATLSFAYDHLDVPSFDVVQGRPPTLDSLRRKKPAPYYLRQTLDTIGVESALYVGDSDHDVVAAHNAGVDAAFLRRDHNDAVSLSATPEYEFTSLHDLTDVVA